MGELIPLPTEITEGMADYEPPVEIPVNQTNKDFKIIYAVVHKHTGGQKSEIRDQRSAVEE